MHILCAIRFYKRFEYFIDEEFIQVCSSRRKKTKQKLKSFTLLAVSRNFIILVSIRTFYRNKKERKMILLKLIFDFNSFHFVCMQCDALFEIQTLNIDFIINFT